MSIQLAQKLLCRPTFNGLSKNGSISDLAAVFPFPVVGSCQSLADCGLFLSSPWHSTSPNSPLEFRHCHSFRT